MISLSGSPPNIIYNIFINIVFGQIKCDDDDDDDIGLHLSGNCKLIGRQTAVKHRPKF